MNKVYLENDVIIFVLQKDSNEQEDSFLRYFLLLSLSGLQKYILRSVCIVVCNIENFLSVRGDDLYDLIMIWLASFFICTWESI